VRPEIPISSLLKNMKTTDYIEAIRTMKPPALINSELLCDACDEDLSLEAYDFFVAGYEAAKEDIKDTLGIFVSKKLAKAREEGVHLGVNNFETWTKQYHEDKDFVGSFGDWIDKLLTSTQEKD